MLCVQHLDRVTAYSRAPQPGSQGFGGDFGQRGSGKTGMEFVKRSISIL